MAFLGHACAEHFVEKKKKKKKFPRENYFLLLHVNIYRSFQSPKRKQIQILEAENQAPQSYTRLKNAVLQHHQTTETQTLENEGPSFQFLAENKMQRKTTAHKHLPSMLTNRYSSSRKKEKSEEI